MRQTYSEYDKAFGHLHRALKYREQARDRLEVTDRIVAQWAARLADLGVTLRVLALHLDVSTSGAARIVDRGRFELLRAGVSVAADGGDPPFDNGGRDSGRGDR